MAETKNLTMTTIENMNSGVMPTALVDPLCSTDNVWYKEDMEYALTTKLDTMDALIASKASTNHTHSDYIPSSDFELINNLISFKADAYHEHEEYALVNHSHVNEYDVNGAAASALTSANAYINAKIDALVGEGASTTLDTIGEISSAIEDNQDAIDLLNSAIANKANVSHTHTIANITNLQNTLDNKASSTHTHSVATTSSSGFMSANDKVKLDVMVIATVSEVETYLGI